LRKKEKRGEEEVQHRVLGHRAVVAAEALVALDAGLAFVIRMTSIVAIHITVCIRIVTKIEEAAVTTTR